MPSVNKVQKDKLKTQTNTRNVALKQLIVFMPELNENGHKTVFITNGKPGLKELIQGTFTNVE